MSDATRELAMFPLGSVLFPGMPLPLRVFEPRYVAMLSSVLGETEREFGVVLIERGSEVGGGDVRFGVGTVARIASVEITEGSIVLLATGAARFEVVRWLADDPFPRAQVREFAALELDAPAVSGLAAAEAVVRATIARASEFVELPWSADIALSDEVAERIWQVAGIAPLGSLDQFELLRCRTATELLARLVEETEAADVRFTARWWTTVRTTATSVTLAAPAPTSQASPRGVMRAGPDPGPLCLLRTRWGSGNLHRASPTGRSMCAGSGPVPVQGQVPLKVPSATTCNDATRVTRVPLARCRLQQSLRCAAVQLAVCSGWSRCVIETRDRVPAPTNMDVAFEGGRI